MKEDITAVWSRSLRAVEAPIWAASCLLSIGGEGVPVLLMGSQNIPAAEADPDLWHHQRFQREGRKEEGAHRALPVLKVDYKWGIGITMERQHTVLVIGS